MTDAETPVSPAPILVTGAVGNIGCEVVSRLLDRGQKVRAADIDPAAVRSVFSDRVEAVRFDFTDAATWPVTFHGIEVMFLMRPPQLSSIARDMVPALEAAKAAGIRHVVLLSLQGAEGNKIVPHAKIEAWLRSSGLAWTFVRPSFFMEKLTGTHVSDIRDRDELMVPAGKGATSFVAASAIAGVSVVALLDPTAHAMRAWTPTGPQALTYEQVAADLSRVLGRPIRYRRPGIPRYAWHAKRTLGMPLAMVGVTTAIYTVSRLGRAAGLTEDVQTVTGHEPVAFADWAQENRDAWLR
ncbi:MAG: NmrA family NAD(P)-binding protein [Candidatus Nanopelagicales bacterium]